MTIQGANSTRTSSMSSSQKRLFVYFALAVGALVWMYLPETENAGDFFGEQSGHSLETSPSLTDEILSFLMLMVGIEEPPQMEAAKPVPPPPPKTLPSDLTAVEIEKFRLAFEPSLSSLRVIPNLVSEPAWLALDHIDSWYAVPASVTENELFSYLQHDRLWVRLAAVQFTFTVKSEFMNVLQDSKDQIVRVERRSQVMRFLKRAERLNPEVYFKMREFLGV